MPVAAYAKFLEDSEIGVEFTARVIAIDGSKLIEVNRTANIVEPTDIQFFARSVAREALEKGAAEILAEVKHES